MFEFMFRVSLEFKTLLTEMTEDEVVGYKPQIFYYGKPSPNFNAQIVEPLESVGVLACVGHCGHQIFPKEQPPNTWLVGNGNETSHERENIGKYGACVRTPPLSMGSSSFQNNYRLQFCLCYHKFLS
jgi:hypothetical protein